MENKTTTLRLREVYELEAELNGLTIGENIIYEGLLKQKLSIPLKYKLKKLLNVITDEKKEIDDTKNELIVKYGTHKEDGSTIIEPFTKTMVEVDGVMNEVKEENPNFRKFSEEYGSLLNIKKDIEHYSFDMEDFSKIETNDDYNVFYKLFDK